MLRGGRNPKSWISSMISPMNTLRPLRLPMRAHTRLLQSRISSVPFLRRMGQESPDGAQKSRRKGRSSEMEGGKAF